MINAVKSLLKRTEEIEDNLKEIEEITTNSINSFFSIDNNFSNLAILSKEDIFVGEINTLKNSKISLQLSFNINLSARQSITFKLKAGDITLKRLSQEYAIGNHNITLSETYTPVTNSLVKIYLEICSDDNKLIYLQDSSLTVWGAVQTEKTTHDYQATKTTDKILLSYIKNNSLYYKFVNQKKASFEPSDFCFHSRSINHSFVFLNSTDKMYLLRIDINKNLLFSEFQNSNEIVIDTNVSFVSACSSDDTIVVSYIKNNFCYIFKIQNNIFSISEKFTKLKRLFLKSSIYFNKHSNHFYLILTDTNQSNYLIESIIAKHNSNENIKAKYNIKITTYGE